MKPEELFDQWLEGAVQRDRQVEASGVHLTVAQLLVGHSRGRLDFGGSEYQAAPAHPIEPSERKPGDKFAYWRLDPGTYVVRFNEKLKEGAPPALLMPNQQLLSSGCTLATAMCGPGEIRSVLVVPSWGANIKQNARIALLCPL